MRLSNRHILILILSIQCGISTAQNGLLRRGDRCFEALSYLEAIAHYEQAFKRGATSIDHARKLAESHWELRDQRNAAKWYSKVAESGQAIAKDLYRHAELLRIQGRLEESDHWIELYTEMEPEDSRGHRKAGATMKLGAIMEEGSLCHKVDKLSMNSDLTDMAPFIHGDKIYFSSARMPEYLSQNHHTWNDQPFLNLYNGMIDQNGVISDVRPVGDRTNTAHHESNLILSPDGREMYFTRNQSAADTKRSSDGVTKLKIVQRKKTDSGWSEDIGLPFDHPDHSFGHPALSRNGQRLFYTSDMPGGVGGRDIWYSNKKPDGTWSEPVNAGTTINTEGDEMFPYCHGNYLYFASDGHLGFGGSDLFRARWRGSELDEVKNLGPPLNGPTDDFGICLDASGDLGFFTSDRSGGIGAEDIYMFRMHSKPENERQWHGRIMDIDDASPLAFVQVQAISVLDGSIQASTMSDLHGTYSISAPPERTWLQIAIPGGHQNILPEDEIAISKWGDTELPDVYLSGSNDLPILARITDRQSKKALEGARMTIKDILTGTVLFHGISDSDGMVSGYLPHRAFGERMDLIVQIASNGHLSRSIELSHILASFKEWKIIDERNGALTRWNHRIDLAHALDLTTIDNEVLPDMNDPALLADLRSAMRTLEIHPMSFIEIQGEWTAVQDLRSALIAMGTDPDRIHVEERAFSRKVPVRKARLFLLDTTATMRRDN